MGRKPDEANQMVIDDLKLTTTLAEFNKLSYSKQPSYFCRAQLLPGAAKLINHLHKHDIPMMICTGSSSEAFENKTRNKPEMNELFSKMKYILKCGSDARVTKGKPDPCAYRVILQKCRENDRI